jgi:hypothetical protein
MSENESNKSPVEEPRPKISRREALKRIASIGAIAALPAVTAGCNLLSYYSGYGSDYHSTVYSVSYHSGGYSSAYKTGTYDSGSHVYYSGSYGSGFYNSGMYDSFYYSGL